MMASLLSKGVKFIHIGKTYSPFAVGPVLTRNYAARKGTRERKKKQKVKVEVQKVGFIPHNQRNKEKLFQNRPKKNFDDFMLPLPQDNVYIQKFYQWKVYTFAEAVKNHRETHHPDIYNVANANLHARIELNMEGPKKTRFVENFTRIASVPHKFDHGEERSILAFSKSVEAQEAAIKAGARLVGGVELVKEVQNGNLMLQDFKFVVAHPNILPELVALRGLMKKKFPNPKYGTLGPDLETIVNKYINGINYSAVQDEFEKDFGLIETVIGTLNMDTNHLEENFASLIQDIYTMKPKREGTFISRCLLWSPPSREKFKVDYSLYVDLKKDTEEDSDDEKDEMVVVL